MRAILKGTLVAVASALCFGATTPLVQRAGRDAGPFATAFLLYAGASIVSLPGAVKARHAHLRRADLPRIALVALLGAAVAPTFFAWGLQRSSAFSASILLNLEVVFTVLLARMLFRESVSRRIVLAVLLMIVGGIFTLLGSTGAARTGSAWGTLALLAAVFAWALDNSLARPLADRDAAQVVGAKSLVGAVATFALCVATQDAWPSLAASAALLACGGLGYGVSLQLYVRAQRGIGAARTASVFALAPFVGALLAWLMADRAGGVSLAIASSLFGLGAWLHLSERHHHAHTHLDQEHEHTHRHDDGHHAHTHDTYPQNEHSHPHRHERIDHTHEHGEDLHHRHEEA